MQNAILVPSVGLRKKLGNYKEFDTLKQKLTNFKITMTSCVY